MLFILPQLPLAVVPILIGPLQVLLAFLPTLVVATGGALLVFLRPASIRMAILLIAAMVASLCYGVPKMTRAFARSHVAAYTNGAKWPMFRGGIARRGGGEDGAADPTSGGRVWSFAPQFKTCYASPAIIGNRILISTATRTNRDETGAIYCLDAAKGDQVWEFAPGDFRATVSSPSVAGKYVVCGEGMPPARDGRIFCISFESGQKLWEQRTAGCVEAAPCIAGEMVFCGAGADGVYGLRLDTPPGGSPVVWHLVGRAGQKYNCTAAIAAVDGCVYFSSASMHEQEWSGIVCVAAATGEEIWHADATLPVWGAPTIQNGRLFVGMGLVLKQLKWPGSGDSRR